MLYQLPRLSLACDSMVFFFCDCVSNPHHKIHQKFGGGGQPKLTHELVNQGDSTKNNKSNILKMVKVDNFNNFNHERFGDLTLSGH